MADSSKPHLIIATDNSKAIASSLLVKCVSLKTRGRKDIEEQLYEKKIIGSNVTWSAGKVTIPELQRFVRNLRDQLSRLETALEVMRDQEAEKDQLHLPMKGL